MHGKSKSIAVGLVFTAVASVIGVAAALAPAQQAPAARPDDERQVLLQVPARASAEGQRIARLRAQNIEKPRDLASALLLARAHIDASRVDGDPRPLGYADAALLPFAAQAAHSPELLVLRATIAQSRHRFADAHADLERALVLAPDDAQARLTSASVLTVLGHHDEARAACEALTSLTVAPLAAICVASVDMLNGRSKDAQQALSQALSLSRDALQRAWLLSLRCELGYWREAPAAAEDCRAALQLDGTDRYTRALLFDVLFDTGRRHEALAVVEGHDSDDALALRAALAAHALDSDDAAERTARLRARFAQNRLRGDSLHQREEGRLLLATAHDELPEALRLARQNFSVQREPWDARLLLEAALSAGQPSAAEPALAWLRQSGFESPRLRMLAARLEAL